MVNTKESLCETLLFWNRSLREYNFHMPRAKTPAPRVEFDELLAAEFNYIAATANQANEDRARVSSFYLVAVGSLVAALFGTQLANSLANLQAVNFMFSLLFFLLTYLGDSTIKQLARLRAAWHESVTAMNHIKDFVIEQKPEIRQAFDWRTVSIPPKYKKGSVSYYQATEVALIGGLMFGAGVFFLLQTFAKEYMTPLHWVVSIVTGGLMILYHLYIYKHALT